MRPLIGITCSYEALSNPPRERSYLNAGYSDAILAAGGMPFPIAVPARFDPEYAEEVLRRCSGLLFTGGPDLDPRHYHEMRHEKTETMHPRRDGFELRFYQFALERDVPTLAICLGCQIAAVACGGSLIQHLGDSADGGAAATPVARGAAGVLRHSMPDHSAAYHPVRVVPGTRLAQIVGSSEFEVNSRHHQAVRAEHLPGDLRASAFAPDGVLEAAEAPAARFRIAVQWHPEDMIDRREHLRLFEALVQECVRSA